MHPLFVAPRRLAAYLSIWLLLGLVRATLLVFEGGLPWSTALAVALPLVLLYGFMCAASWYVCRAQPLQAGRVLRSVAVQLCAAVLAAALWVGLASIWDKVLTGELPPPSVRGSIFLSGVLLYLLVAAAYYVVIAVEDRQRAERNVLEIAVQAREAELKALRAQINPHFLFNSLHSISALTTSNPQAARTMCLRLGDFLRHGLKYGAMDEIPLEGELTMVEQYLAIEQIRFGERLRVEWDCEPTARECRLPPLLLQPLVENAIRHGVATLVEGGTIVVAARRLRDRLQLSVENPYDPDTPRSQGSGVGLQNVRERLRTRYGRAGTVRVENSPGRFRVTLDLPALQPA